MKIYIKIMSIFLIAILLLINNLYSQYCNKTCSEGEFAWGPEIFCITQLQQYPSCSIKLSFQRGFCGENEISCFVKINKIEFLSGNCPSPSLLTIPEFIRLTTESLLSNNIGWSCLLSSCPKPSIESSRTVEIWYKSPCWRWDGIINPSGPPPPIIPCGEDGCCKVTYLVHYINDNIFQPVRLFQQVDGICQPNYQNCINICE